MKLVICKGLFDKAKLRGEGVIFVSSPEKIDFSLQYDEIIVDLNIQGVEEFLEKIKEMKGKKIGYYSHVDVYLREIAKPYMDEIIPRSRFF